MSSISYILLELFIYIQNMQVKLLQPCPILGDAMDCSPSVSSAHGILQARILKGVAMPSSKGSSWPTKWTHVSYISCIDRWVLYHWKPKACVYVHTHTHTHTHTYFPIFKCICSLPSIPTAFYTNDTKWYILCTKTPLCFFPNITTFDTLSHE